MRNLFGSTFAVTLSILLVVPDVSIAENEPQLTEVHLNKSHDDQKFYKDHLTKTTVNGRIQYVLGARIAGKIKNL